MSGQPFFLLHEIETGCELCPSSDAFPIFLFSSPSQFVDHCSALTQDCPEVLTFLQSKYSKASPDYLSSVEFRNSLGRCLTRAQTNRSKTFVYINELCTVLKQHAFKKRQILTKVEPGHCTSTSNFLQSTSIMLESKEQTKDEVDKEEDRVTLVAMDTQPSTSINQKEGKNVKEEQESEKKEKRASRKQVSFMSVNMSWCSCIFFFFFFGLIMTLY